MNWEVMVFVLLAAGLLLIFAELFIPSGGVISILCLCCFAGSGYAAWKVWYGTHPAYWWIYVASVILLIPAAIFGAFQILTKTSLGDRVLLTAPSEDEVNPYRREEQRLAELIGQRGVALNLMTPGGLVNVGGERLHAISEGLMIESGTTVEVVAARGTRIIVRPISPAEDSRAENLTESNSESKSGSEQIDPWRDEERPA